MGLSGTKRRNKISNDPNNTTWSKSTNGFGHKILSAQGWRPGQVLGAENASHAEHFTAATTSHIRVALREDNLGLGAQLGKSNADTFGLSTLSGIFGRLNGKSGEEIEKQASAQRDVELRSYQTRKYGTMNFVRGGILVGDKIEDLQNELRLVGLSEKETEQHYIPTPAATATTEAEASPRVGKRKRMDDDQSAKLQADKDMRALLKAEKRARKEARRKKRAAQHSPDGESSSTAGKVVKAEIQSTSIPTSGTSTPSFAGSRHNVRQRFIQQKRLASMDARALNEILMQKTPVC